MASAAALPQRDYLTLAGWRNLLLVLALIVAPQLLHSAPWISACVLCLGIWRYLVARNGWALPGKYLRLLFAIIAFVAVWATYRSLNGIVAGSALLTIMLALKLTETWQRRDCLLLIYLGYVLILAQFLYEQSLLTALYLIPVIWLHTALFLGVTHPGTSLPPRTALRMSSRYLLSAVPLMLILFVLFPRIPGGVWGTGNAGGAGVTGLDGNMSPGSISQLMQSDTVAFRVTFADSIPPKGKRYWRGTVLHAFDGETWRRGEHIPPLSHPLEVEQLTRYTITLEPHAQHWLYALDVATNLPADSRMQKDYVLLRHRPVNHRLRYSASSALQATIGKSLSLHMRQRDLQLPAGYNPQTRALANQWQRSLPNDRAIVNAALQRFHEQAYYYTLQPPPLGHHSIDDFLFNTRRGFCEHYASAFVFLMRAAGVPARVVVGYLGMEKNPLDDYFIVRQSDAHAWAEVWLAEEGWVRVDPTAAIHPSRIEVEAEQALANVNLMEGSWFNLTLLKFRLQYSWDSIIAQWHGMVLAYGPQAQKDLLRSMGLSDPSWRNLLLLLVGLLMAAGIVVIVVLSWRNRPIRQPPLVRTYRRFCRQLARAGVARQATEGPQDFSRRAQQALPDQATAIARISGLYQRLQYGGEYTPVLEQAFIRQVRAFKKKGIKNQEF